MAEDFTLVFLAELVAGLFVFCLLSAFAYRKIKRFKQDVSSLRHRLDAVSQSLHASRQELQDVVRESENRLSASELEHGLSLFSMHVLHHLPKAGGRKVAVAGRRQGLKSGLRSR